MNLREGDIVRKQDGKYTILTQDHAPLNRKIGRQLVVGGRLLLRKRLRDGELYTYKEERE